MAKAKTASKNNPTMRAAAADVMYNNEKVVPVKFVGVENTYMAAFYTKSNKLVRDESNTVMRWSQVATLSNSNVTPS